MDSMRPMETIACGLPPSPGISPTRVGTKAASLIQMAESGLPVPPGFVFTTEVCREYFARHGQLPDDFGEWLEQGLELLERSMHRRFGGNRRPLLLSVRSGAPVSMPGMMDSILNVGLTDATASALICETGNPRFVWDSYRRLLEAFGEVVYGLPPARFQWALWEVLRSNLVDEAKDLDAFALRELVQKQRQLIAGRMEGRGPAGPFPQDPRQQLRLAVEAVFRSWQGERAVAYRRLQGIPESLGTAVTVQAMVFGNAGGTSGSGVAFTRDPAGGKRHLYVDFAWNAQGEDIVAGRHLVEDIRSIRHVMPRLEEELEGVSEKLEALFRDAQDFEFTVQNGQLFLLQSRSAKRTDQAALRIACDLVEEGLIEPSVALGRIADVNLDLLVCTRIASPGKIEPLAQGVPASPGIATGPLALDSASAVALAKQGRTPILVRQEIAADDVAGMAVAAGILTKFGGRTSHAAVVARQMNKVCIVGCRDVTIERRGRCRIGNRTLVQGEEISLDGETGAVYAGSIAMEADRPLDLLAKVDRWKTLTAMPAE